MSPCLISPPSLDTDYCCYTGFFQLLSSSFVGKLKCDSDVGFLSVYRSSVCLSVCLSNTNHQAFFHYIMGSKFKFGA